MKGSVEDPGSDCACSIPLAGVPALSGLFPLFKPVLQPMVSSVSPHYLPVSPFLLKMTSDGNAYL